jgi:polysaccharide export outer membrane protein
MQPARDKTKFVPPFKNLGSFWVTCLVVFFAIAGLTGCGTTNYTDLPTLTSETPGAPAAGALPPYRVQVGDVLDIKFRLNPELDETVTVRPDGMISTSMFQDISVYDKSVSEVNDDLKDLYGQELQKPQISTIVRSFAPTRLYVMGEVSNPGEFIVVGPALTLTQAIARAGGTLNSAHSDKVLILRRGAGEKSSMYVADYHGATQGGDPMKDVRLSPFDVVFVPKSGAALTYKAYQQYIQQYIGPTVGASYQIDR